MNAAARRKSISPSGLAQREDRRNPGEPTREIDPFHFDSYGNCEAEFLRKILKHNPMATRQTVFRRRPLPGITKARRRLRAAQLTFHAVDGR
jgi:hypothetical protein